MAELKTKVNDASVEAFINSVADEQKRADSHAIAKLMSGITGHPAKMWGTGIIGFDSYHYKYDSGHEGDMCLIGFSPRKASISLYLMCYRKFPDLLKQLGKHKEAKGCLYINKLNDVDIKVLKKLIEASIKEIKANIKAKKEKSK